MVSKIFMHIMNHHAQNNTNQRFNCQNRLRNSQNIMIYIANVKWPLAAKLVLRSENLSINMTFIWTPLSISAIISDGVSRGRKLAWT